MPDPAVNGHQSGAVLEIDDLWVSIHTEEGVVEAVRGVSFALEAGEVLGIVGESGSGKSVTAMSLIGLTAENANFELEGEIRFEGERVLEFDEERLRQMRGAGMAMIFQDPMTSLTPVYKVGELIAETIRAHLVCSRAQANERAVAMMKEVGIPDPARRANAYPHQLSGGMRQRVMIAMALACEPSVLIADEPTTALDVTIQAQILRLIKRLQREHGTAVVMISHDLGVISKMADSVAVMYAGKVVEMAPVRELFAAPQHPYAWGLLGSAPRLSDDGAERLVSIPGQPPSLIGIGEGCAFRDRCAFAHDRCVRTPPLEPRSGADHLDACWLETAGRSELRESRASA